VIILLLLVLGGLAAWGINQSARVAALFTLAEIAGLLLILFVSSDQLTAMDQSAERLHSLEQIGLSRHFSLLGLFSGEYCRRG